MGKRKEKEEVDTADSKSTRRSSEVRRRIHPPEDMVVRWTPEMDNYLLIEIAKCRNRRGPYSTCGNWSSSWKLIKEVLRVIKGLPIDVTTRDLEARAWILKVESTVMYTSLTPPLLRSENLLYEAFKEPLLPPPPRPSHGRLRSSASASGTAGTGSCFSDEARLALDEARLTLDEAVG